MAFNIYKWRRDQLLIESSIHPDPKDLTTNPEANIKQQREQVNMNNSWKKNAYQNN